MADKEPEAMATEEVKLEGPKKGVVDYTALQTQLDELKAVAKGNVEEALEKLLAIEKTHRLGGDAVATKKVCIAVVQVCFVAGQYKSLNEHIVLLSKRRSQLKQAMTGMVQEVMTYLEKVPDVETKVELITTLNTVTAGKIYVEVERARLVRQLAKIKEDQGDIDAAADAMQEVAVETYGAMAKTEKVAFILEQVRLCLDKKDFIRATILSKKISPRTFTWGKVAEGAKAEDKEKPTAIADQTAPEQPPLEGTPTLPELKLRYYKLLIRIHIHSADYLEVCRCYQSIYADEEVAKDSARWQPALRKICWYVILAPYGTEQSSMLHAVSADVKLEDIPQYHSLLKLFTTKEVIRWPMVQETYEAAMAAEAEIFGGEAGVKRTEDLQQRVVEHNILVIRTYYSRITLTRLSQLLDLTVAAAEKHLSDMVVSKTIKAKLDRPAGIVDFVGRKDASDLLNAWSNNIERVLSLVDQSCHKIHKEAMSHKVPIGV